MVVLNTSWVPFLMYKLTYITRGCPWKCDTRDEWLPVLFSVWVCDLGIEPGGPPSPIALYFCPHALSTFLILGYSAPLPLMLRSCCSLCLHFICVLLRHDCLFVFLASKKCLYCCSLSCLMYFSSYNKIHWTMHCVLFCCICGKVKLSTPVL